MDALGTNGPAGRRLLLPAILVLAALTRLYHFQAPLMDQMFVKQVYVANKARSIARPPLNPFRDSLDFLDPSGDRTRLTEEVPLYTGLLGAGYRAFGEREWIGRVFSILATLAAIVALHGLVRREYDEEGALVAALLFASAPLMIFYGRAVMPDAPMLAGMLAAACFYRRYLDEGRKARWLLATIAAGMAGALFKYYGLMVLIPLADLAYRRDGWRAWTRPRFLLMAAAMVAPIALWMGMVFFRSDNPTARMPYFCFQEPAVLLNPRLYECLTARFFARDCGIFATALIVAGLIAAATGKVSARPILGWAVAGLTFFFLFAPKTLYHDYYEMMLLPAAAMGGMLGWKALRSALANRAPRRRAWVSAVVLAAIAIGQSPLLVDAKFEQHAGQRVLAGRLGELCPPSGRFVVLGHPYSWAVVHYSGREGWIDQSPTLRPDWSQALSHYHSLGAEYVALYFDAYATPAQRATYGPLQAALPEVEHRSGPWFPRGKTCEYYILDLRHYKGEPPAGRSVAIRSAESRSSAATVPPSRR